MKIKFKRDTSFRKQFFVADSFAHPAKMDAQLLIWIVEHYSEAGETILDPMAGSGTTMLACTLGRDCILVELEEKFCKMMRDNWEQVKMRPQLGSTMGECKIIQGDARQLEGLCDKIISSPPYEQSLDRWAGDKRNKLMEDKGLHAMPKEGLVDKIVTSPPYESGGHHNGIFQTWGGGHAEGVVGQAAGESKEHGYGHSQSNIGNLKSESYLEAMLQVYQQCYKVLKPEGLMILVVKPFIRNQKLVSLQEDTKQLCRQAGFSFLEEHQRILPAQSFWRVIYAKRFPLAPKIDCEYVLVFKKDGEL